MTRNSLKTTARHTLTSLLAAFALTATLPHAALASDTGFWKVDPAKSKFNATSATLTIKRIGGKASAANGQLLVISGTQVYLVDGSSSFYGPGLKPVDFANMERAGDAVLIGRNVRSNDACGFKCRASLPEDTRTVTFKIVNKGERQIEQMLAYEQN